MTVATEETRATPEPEVIHRMAGRLRVRLPGWTGLEPRRVTQRLREIPGVTQAQVNVLTRNALIHFDPARLSEADLLSQITRLRNTFAAYQATESDAPPAAVHRQGETVRARIAVRGLDRDPEIARRVVERLQRQPGVRAKASPLTGRVLVEFAQGVATVDDLVAQVADVELPDEPGEDRPADPLDPKPLIQSATRAIGAALGLALVAVQQGVNEGQPLINSTAPATLSGVIGILRGFPFVRNGLRKLLGRDVADLLLTVPDIASQALANSPLGLVTGELEATILLSETRARRAAWRRYAARLEGAVDATPGAVIRLETGERIPRTARVIEGFGTGTGRSGAPIAVAPGIHVPAGARLFGGPFVVELEANSGFAPQSRPAPLRPTIYDHYVRLLSPLSVGYALVTALLTRSLSRTFAALLLVSPRAAVIGMEAADLDASAYALRAGVTIAGTRLDRTIRRPDVVLLDGPRLLTSRFEVTNVLALSNRMETADVLGLAARIAAAAGSPWGGAFRAAPASSHPATPASASVSAHEGRFDGELATAEIADERYSLGPVSDWSATPEAAPLRQRGDYALELRREGDVRPLGLIALRPRLVDGVRQLVEACQRARVELVLAPGGDSLVARGVARRAEIPILEHDDALGIIRERQARGDFVTFVSDGAHAAAAFDAADLAIGLTDGRSPLAARADLIAPDLGAVAAVVRAGIQRDRAVRDSVGFSIVSNVFGAVWGFQGSPGIGRAARGVYVAAIAALGDGWLRLRGGERPQSVFGALSDPRPERWGARTVAETLAALSTTADGLSSVEAARRRHQSAPAVPQPSLLDAIGEQLRSPMTAILGVGAGISLLLGAPADVAIIGATIAANVAVGAWQERKANQVSQTLERLSAANARVLRDGRPTIIPAGEVVPGDVLLLGAGERVTADARLIEAQALEVDEASLTGESLPVLKTPDAAVDASRVLLDGSDIIVGVGRAVAFAVGRDTRMGTITAALSVDETKQSQLNRRLGQLVGQVAPLAIGGGALVFASGFLRTGAALSQLTIGATLALTAVPEGLPLLTQVSEAGVARRLAERHAVVRRLPAVEALGRVDVICTDKTGTLTEGKLALRLLASADEQRTLPSDDLPPALRDILLTAALASPHPDAPAAAAHPTDGAVIHAAEAAGLGQRIRSERQVETPFDPVRSYHATLAGGRLCLKGAPEVLIARCVRLRRDGRDEPLDEAGRQRLLQRAQHEAQRGLRVLFVAEGPATTAPDELGDLTALGFLGINDPLREAARAAVRRCHDAGVRVIMLTGDHPATAEAIAREAGLLDGVSGSAGDGALLTGAEIAELHNGDLERRLEQASVIARATPLDKLRIVESLQRRGHTVAMTGDGVNDAPALRLADIGVAMGRGATEVARQTADVVITDDNFATLVETFVEGRSFWRNIRRAIGLLLGGNLGELGMVVGASALGFASPLTARQALIVNAITDILPGLAVGLQQPETRNLSGLAREGASALDRPLWNDVARRGVFTAGPSLTGYLVALAAEGLPQARTVAFASIVGSQLVQTLDMGWSEGTLSGPVLGSVVGSAALMGLTLAVPSFRSFLSLALPTPLGWGLIAGATGAALTLSRLAALPPPPAPPPPLALPAPGETSAAGEQQSGD